MSSQEDVGVLNIDKVIITGLTIPVIGAEGGIPLSLIVNAIVKVLIDPWFNQAAFDTAELLINEEPTAVVTKTINPGEENQRFTMDLPAAFLRNGINRIRLRVTRVSQEPETSADLVVLYHTPRPGGEVVGSGDNPNLLMTLPADVIANGVDAARAAQGVDVTLSYVHMREHDKITLDCDGHTVLHTVTAAQAAARIVILKLFADAFPRDNPHFAMRFRVIDQIGNSSGPLAIWSKTTEIDVHLQQPALDLRPPSVLEANGTLLNIQEDFYDAEFATVQVAFTGSAPRQTVKVYCVGRNSTYGSEIQTIEYSGQTLTFKVKRIDVIDCIGKVAKVYYTVQRSIDPMPLESRPLHLSVTQVGNLVLTEPRLSSDKRTAMVSYVGMSTGYSVRIAWYGKYKRYGAEFNITNTSEMRLPIESSWITESAGLPVQINYTILRTGSGEKLRFSWVLRLHL